MFPVPQVISIYKRVEFATKLARENIIPIMKAQPKCAKSAHIPAKLALGPAKMTAFPAKKDMQNRR